MEQNCYLFVYGTLLDDRNPFGAYLKNSTRLHNKGRLCGKLFDLGEYPGAVLEHGAEHFVYGRILVMEKPEEMLKMLDDYEGFGNYQPHPNEFIRDSVEIQTDDGPVNCWVYLYNRPVEGLWQITSGNYMEYIGI